MIYQLPGGWPGITQSQGGWPWRKGAGAPKEKEGMKVEVDGTKAASIIQVLQELAGGDFAFDASKRLQKVVEAVKLYKGKGKLIMELKISPLPKFGEVAVNVEPKLKLELPDKSYKNSIRFIGKDDVLQTTDPAQQDFSNLEKSFSKPQN